MRDESRSFQDSGSVEGVSEEEEALVLVLLLLISSSSRFDPQRDGRVHVGHRQRDDRRRWDLHLRAVQRLEPFGRRPRREREGRKKESCFADAMRETLCGLEPTIIKGLPGCQVRRF